MWRFLVNFHVTGPLWGGPPLDRRSVLWSQHLNVMLCCHCNGGWMEVPGLSTCLVPESQPLTAAFLALLVEVPDMGSELHPSNILITFAKLHCTWWRHQMRIFSTSLALCEWGPPVTGGFPLTGTSDVALWLFLWPAPQQTVKQIMETPVIWDASDFDETHCLLMAPNMIYYYNRQQWLRRWLAAYRPKASPKPKPIWDYWHPSQFCFQILSNQSVSEQNTALLSWCILRCRVILGPDMLRPDHIYKLIRANMDQMCMFSHTYSTRYMSVKFQSEHKYVLFFKWTIIVRLRWTTTSSYWGRTIMANFQT